MRLATKSGLALIVLGFGILDMWSWWKGSRNFVPVNTPISLNADGLGLTAEFKLNFDALYLIEIEAQKPLPPAIEANWTLSSAGRQIKAGSAKDSPATSGPSSDATRVIGEFQGRAGKNYTLQVDSVSDGGRLSAANPRLKVAVASIAYTDLQSAGVLVFSMAFICVLFGMILLAIAFDAKRKASVRSPDYRE